MVCIWTCFVLSENPKHCAFKHSVYFDYFTQITPGFYTVTTSVITLMHHSLHPRLLPMLFS